MCDQPHPLVVKRMIESCLVGDINTGYEAIKELWDLGYAPIDIIGTIFRVVKNFEHGKMAEWTKLEFIKKIGQTHLKILEGQATLIQLTGLVAQLARMGVEKPFDA